ncbi:MAG: 3-oxoacyl-[acyl-carrier-protein] synthase III C-terminal domain-containing protein [Adlercreutzia sp.]
MTTDDVTCSPAPGQRAHHPLRRQKMGLPMERFQVIIDHVGNVSGASALIALNGRFARTSCSRETSPA